MAKIISEERITKYALDAKSINELMGIHKDERLGFMEEMVQGAILAETGPFRIKVTVLDGRVDWRTEFHNYLVRVLTRKHGVAKAQKKAVKVMGKIEDGATRKPIVEFSPEANPKYKQSAA